MRNHTASKRLATIVLLLVTASFTFAFPAPVLHADANPTPSPFTKMLSLVPSLPDITGFSYDDMTDLWVMYPGALRPRHFADLSKADPSQVEYNETAFVLGSLNYGNVGFLSGFLSGEMILDDGIDPFSVDRVLDVQYSQTSVGQLTIFNGQFDPATIGEVLTKHGFTKTDYEGAALWCDPHGCDSGKMKDPAASSAISSVFGFQQPIGVTADYVFSSPSLSILKQVADRLHTNAFSWQDVPYLYATSEALSARANLIDAAFIPAAFSPNWDLLAKAKSDKYKNMFKAYTTIPQYHGILFGFATDDKDQLSLTALVYDNATDAQTAAKVLPARLTAFQPLIGTRSYQQILTATNGSVDDPGTVYDATGTGKFVSLIAARNPIPPLWDGSSPIPSNKRTIFSTIVTDAGLHLAFWLIPKYAGQ